MNIDIEILYYFNSFAQRIPSFDILVKILSTNVLIKGGVFLTAFWFFWFHRNNIKDRSTMICNFFGSSAVMIFTRLLAASLPFRQRPKVNAELNFILPSGSRIEELMSNSSFPSDHAALFYSLATGFYLLSKRAGIAAFIYTTAFIALPRIYLGLHYPSDIVCGATIGIVGTWLANRPIIKEKIAPSVFEVENRQPGIFYAVMFLISLQIATLFKEARELARWIFD